MQHQNNSPHRIEARLWVTTLCVACVLVQLSVASTEANASWIFPVGGGPGAIISTPETNVWDIGDRLVEEIKNQDTGPSLPGRPSDIVHALTAPHHEIAEDSTRSSLWIDENTARFNFNLLLEDLPRYGPVQLQNTGAVDLGSRSPVVPVSLPPSSALLFVTSLVGMLGTVFLDNVLTKKAQNTNEFEPHRPCSTPLVVLLSLDVVFARDLQEHLHRAGHAVRVAAAVSEILAVSDPTSLSLVLVDHRIRDWDMLRTDPSLRHVLLMTVVPLGCLYPENQYIWDLERGMDGVHDLRDGHRLLAAKVGAYLWRAGCNKGRRRVYQVGAVELDGDAQEVKIAGRQVKLSAKPFAILTVLMREPSKVFSRNELFNLVWGPGLAVSEHVLDVHVHALRQQLDREPNRLCELLTIKRVGFKLKPVSSAGSIRMRRPRPTSTSISGSHPSSRMTPRLTLGRITRPNRGSLSDPPLKSPASISITSPCG